MGGSGPRGKRIHPRFEFGKSKAEIQKYHYEDSITTPPSSKPPHTYGSKARRSRLYRPAELGRIVRSHRNRAHEPGVCPPGGSLKLKLKNEIECGEVIHRRYI